MAAVKSWQYFCTQVEFVDLFISRETGGKRRQCPQVGGCAVGEPQAKLCRILSLDGGGAKGFYTLGALKEIEGLSGRKLCETFDLVFGTSTGAIIAALVGLGYSVDDILELYRKHVVKVMARWLP